MNIEIKLVLNRKINSSLTHNEKKKRKYVYIQQKIYINKP